METFPAVKKMNKNVLVLDKASSSGFTLWD